MNKKYFIYIIIAILFTLLIILPKFLTQSTTATVMFKKGMHNDEVSRLQKDLTILKLFSSECTGVFDDQTIASVKKFQEQNQLPATGVVDVKTYNTLAQQIIKLKMRRIMLDPGHGGFDVGTSKGDAFEKEITLSISKKIKAQLEALGYTVLMTRDTDISLYSLVPSGFSSEDRDLKARVKLINESNAKLFLSIHVNSFKDSTEINGATVHYTNNYPQSKNLAKCIQTALNNITADNFIRQKREIGTEGFYLLRKAKMPGVLVETGFLSNPRERDLLMTEDFRDKTAKGIVDGLISSKILEEK